MCKYGIQSGFESFVEKYKLEIAYTIHKPKCDIKINLAKHIYSKNFVNKITQEIEQILSNLCEQIYTV